VAKFLATGKTPYAKKRRGMSFYYDVVDWVGGYPYEYASIDEIKNFVEKKGFRLMKEVKSPVPTGCNEFIFIRKPHL
jgi:2-polyprenyl-6-hydroxyphenyl methylase/3-demethylubiquinone-9 3-methyltransferase